jgi:RNA polymerase sigma-70 factor (sigma-E family)
MMMATMASPPPTGPAPPDPPDGTPAIDAGLADAHRDHYRSLVRLASLLVPDRDRCEELVQEAFVSVWRRRGGQIDPDRLPAYLRSAVLNGARSEVRRVVVRRRNPDPAPGAAPSAEAGALAGDETRRVIDALRSLPARQREVLALRYYLQLSEAEIADQLGISAGSVKTHAHRGLAALASRLEDR